MAKKSPAKIKKEAAEIKRTAAARREEKKLQRMNEQSHATTTNSEVDLEYYASVDHVWLELGLAAPARRALIDDGLFKLLLIYVFTLSNISNQYSSVPGLIVDSI